MVLPHQYCNEDMKTKRFTVIISIVCCTVIVFGCMMLGASASISTEPTVKEDIAIAQYANEAALRNELLSEQSISDVITTITFSKYISFEELNDFVQKYDVDISQLQLRGIAETGERISIFTLTELGLAKTEELLKTQAAEMKCEIIGITGMYAYVDSVYLQEIIDDVYVYLVDTSGDQFSLNNTATTCSERNASSANGERVGFPPPLTWALEDMGILTFDKRSPMNGGS